MIERLPNGIEFYRFAIFETPHCVWGTDLKSQNLRFLESLEPRYFEHLADSQVPLLEGPDSRLAALTLRIGYSQALEALFALLGSTLQAPEAVSAWVQLYTLGELRAVVDGITRRTPLRSFLSADPRSWVDFASVTNQYMPGDTGSRQAVDSGFGRAWARFASDFLDSQFTDEYNAIKHGFRIRPGGFTLSYGVQEKFGIPAPPEAMQSLGGSEFGSSFFRTENLARGRTHVKLRRSSRNWHPMNFAFGLKLISMSLANVVGFARIVNGVDSSSVQFSRPPEEAHFSDPWALHVGAIKSEFGDVIDKSNIIDISDEDILSTYDHVPGESEAQQ